MMWKRKLGGDGPIAVPRAQIFGPISIGVDDYTILYHFHIRAPAPLP